MFSFSFSLCFGFGLLRALLIFSKPMVRAVRRTANRANRDEMRADRAAVGLETETRVVYLPYIQW